MTDYATLPLQAHDNRSAFLEHAWNIGKGLPKSGNGIDFDMPIPLPFCTAKIHT
jgi:hypothetical protein